MHKFFIDPSQKDGVIIHISGEDYLHMTKSLRMKIGEKVEVSDCKGMEYITKITKIDKDNILLEIIEERENDTETFIEISLYQGIPKGSKMDLIIQKSVELGVKNIIPVNTHRTIVEIDKKENKKIQRWQKISEEAAKQSKRGVIPQIMPLMKIKDIKNELIKNDLNLIAYEGEVDISLKQALLSNDKAKRIGIVIGPEGGLEEEEVEYLKSLGAIPISLGTRILRTETAGISIIAMLTYHYEM
ncbi:16S rRNA (uracil(1498)-N(3))-methyltransferase [Alkalibaculum sp. M08DMB]|uniref:Ribosomal RNA small subunit methyltransferase E n=1 Tax=Alkalibaculum sporogenes TaxID=2655001 RepID=A0A6A7KDJ3_9FIRM|nr:16S rRNA (uracil(1498)-N(3))-methyltransferase [Alkalibaculum sporogenes]MPW27093.1 16S rRNA (uracil(1498)-N(3))-methyltransferase [Alkalibaculum sporogenes]